MTMQRPLARERDLYSLNPRGDTFVKRYVRLPLSVAETVSKYISAGFCVPDLVLVTRYDTIGEFNVDSKA